MPTLRVLAASIAASSLLLSLFGCGSDGSTATTGGAGGADDGRYHPAGNGVHIAEAEACDTLRQAQSQKLQGMTCTGTSRPCPTLLRAQFSTECMEYDQGSVQGCVDYYNETTTCQALVDAIDKCAVTPFRGTEPKGCPEGQP
jgi:hypothetical protein